MSQSSARFAKVARPFVALSERGKHISIVLAVAVHAMLLAFLFYGIRWQTKVSDAVEVELVRAVPQEAVPAPSHELKPEPPPPPVPKIEPRPVPPLSKPDIALKDKVKPKPPPKIENKPDPFRKQLEQELKQTAAERKSAELASAASRELSQLKAAQTARAAAARDKAVADYIGKIRGRIKSNIVLPADIKGNPEAVFDVVQFPSGEILSVRLRKSSGHAGYDAAVERAILKSSPLPKPDRGDLFERELNLKFRPLED